MSDIFAHSKAGARGLLDTHRSNAQYPSSLAAKKGLRSKQNGSAAASRVDNLEEAQLQAALAATQPRSRNQPYVSAAAARMDNLEEAQLQAALAATQPRLSAMRVNENFQPENDQGLAGRLGNSRRRPTLGSFTAANRSCGGIRGGPIGGAMTDITNVTAGRASLADKSKPIKAYHSFQPPAMAARRDLTPAGPIAPVTEAFATRRESTPAVPIAPVTEAIGTRRELTPAGSIAPVTEVTPQEQAIAQLPDQQLVQEYVPDINNGLFANEALALPQANYMDLQTDITGKMRMILNDWLIEVHMKYRLSNETLHLAVNLIDRYLSKKQITRKRLQLIGVAAMFIASKFEEINPPELRDWVYITDGAYAKDDVIMTECEMLQTLSFKIVVPTAAHFFEQLAVANGCDAVHRSVVQYLLELGLLDIRVLQYKPSQVVAAALLLSNELFTRSTAWPEVMIQQSRHSEQTLRVCAEELRQLWTADRVGAGGQLQAVHKKFSTPQHHSVATMSF